MKKLLFAFAAALLLVGCAKEYDDTALKNRVSELESRVTTLEANVKAISSFPGKIIESQEPVKDADGNVIGYTVKYVTGEVVTFQIDIPTPGDEGQVIGITQVEGVYYWTLDGEPFYPIDVFSYIGFSNGHLYVGGEDRGLVQDAIIKQIEDKGDALVITLYSGDTISIPKAAPFCINVEDEYAVTEALKGKTFDIPYTVTGADENTIVDAITTGIYSIEVQADKFVVSVADVTPFNPAGYAVVWATNCNGKADLHKITFAGPYAELSGETQEVESHKVAAIAEATADATVDVAVTSNVSIKAVSKADWITVVDLKAKESTITLKMAANPNAAFRFGTIEIQDPDGAVVYQTIEIAQKPGEPVTPSFDPTNFAAIDWSNKDAATWYYFAQNYALAEGFTLTLHIYPNALSAKQRVGNFGNNTESPCNMLRFGERSNTAELEWMVDTGAGRQKIYADGFTAQKWNAITLTADATGYKMYVNGELKGSGEYAYNTAMGFGAIEFANSWGKSWRSAFDGRMALLSVYNKALSAEEIAANIFAVPTNEACVGFWLMTEGEGGLLKADQTKAIKENIDLTKAIRNDDDNVTVNYEVDVTPYITWTKENTFVTPDPLPATIAEIIAKIPAEATGDKTAVTFDADLKEPATVTYVNGKNIYMEDATGALLLYLNDANHGIVAGDKISGKISAKAYWYNGIPELVQIGTEYTKAEGTAPAPTKVALADLLANYDSYLLKYVKVPGVTVTGGIADGDRNGEVTVGDNKLAVYAQLNNNGLVLTEGEEGSLTAIVGRYKTTNQLLFWDNSWFKKSGIVIDGDIEDWADIAQFESSANSRIRYWKFAEDATNVYFYLAMRKNRADSGRKLVVGFNTDNDAATGSLTDNNTMKGCEAIARNLIPFTNASGASTLEYTNGILADAEVVATDGTTVTGVVNMAVYDDGSDISSSSSNIHLEISIPKANLVLTAGSTISVGCSYDYYFAGYQSITLK